jgi:hypothetical protein
MVRQLQFLLRTWFWVFITLPKKEELQEDEILKVKD